jgi:hypothetical protein
VSWWLITYASKRTRRVLAPSEAVARVVAVVANEAVIEVQPWKS